MQLAKGRNSNFHSTLVAEKYHKREGLDLSNYCTLGIVGMSLETAAPTLGTKIPYLIQSIRRLDYVWM